MKLKTLNKKNFKNKRIILRAELDVPIKNNKVRSKSRLIVNLDTINYLLDAGAKNITIIGHLGRPEGRDPAKSLKPLKPILEKLLKQKIYFIEEYDKKLDLNKIFENKIILLENLRYYTGETNNTKTFVNHLKQFGDVFVNNCFSTLTRDHASITGLAKTLPTYPGLRIQEELNELTIENRKKPISLVLGGAKLQTKLPVIEHLLKKVDHVLIGGAMVLVLLREQNKYDGKILFDYHDKDIKKIINNPKLVLPEDFVCTKIKNSQKSEIKLLKDITKEDYVYDIGPKSLKKFESILKTSKTIIWNGPLGYYEKPKYAKSTKKLLKYISNLNAHTLIGGGDTEHVLKQIHSKHKMSHVCVGGGAMLKYLSESHLPGLKYIIKN